MSDPYGWRAHVSEDWAMDAHRVVFHRRAGDQREVIVGFDEQGHAVVERSDPMTVLDFRGFGIPREALDALAEVLKPGPSQGETKRLEEALAHEQVRVDALLARMTGLRSPS